VPSSSEVQPNTPGSIARLLEAKGVAEALVCAVTAVAYLATLSFGFVYDDKPVILDSADIRSWSSLLPSVLGTSSGGSFYRPVTMLWLHLNYCLFGLEPAGWHFAMLVGHVVMTYLVFLLVKQLAGNRNTALTASLLFGLHPVHVENVAWLSSVNDLLMSVLLVGSFLAYLRSRESGKLWWVASAFLFALALLSKETAAGFPLLIFGCVLISWDASKETRDSFWPALQRGATALPYFIVLGAYLLVRRMMLHGMGKSITPLSWTTMILTWPSVLWFDLKHLLFPVPSSEFYSLAYVTAPGIENFWRPCFFSLAVILIGAYGISKLQNVRLAFCGVMWVFVPILPTLYLRAIASDNFVHDRFLYLPSVGIVILFALAIEQLSALALPAARGGIAKWATVAVLAGAGFAAVLGNQMQWANNLLLYQNGLKSAPQNLIVQDNLANELADLGRYDRAIPLYLDALQRNPRFWSANYNLGYAYYRIGKYPEAESHLQRAIQIDDGDPDQFIFLARAQMEQGKLTQAVQSAERALQRGPQSPGYHFVLAKILEASGERDRAILEYKTEALYHPGSAPARIELQRLQASQ
jgi:Tfp pilus assembly protein PilF